MVTKHHGIVVLNLLRVSGGEIFFGDKSAGNQARLAPF